MTKYYINKNKQESDNYNNEVHKEDCYWLSLASNIEYLGKFSNCESALKEAKDRGYDAADGCKECSKKCHNE
jgi:hypothetical protein